MIRYSAALGIASISFGNTLAHYGFEYLVPRPEAVIWSMVVVYLAALLFIWLALKAHPLWAAVTALGMLGALISDALQQTKVSWWPLVLLLAWWAMTRGLSEILQPKMSKNMAAPPEK
jgi:hypothetical protein